MRTPALIVAAVLVAALFMAARPGTEQQLIQQLNGQQTRWLLPDGGASGVFTQFDGGSANNFGCMPILGGISPAGVPLTPNVLAFVPLVPVNECMRPSVFSPLWDGGCNATITDVNYGIPLPVNVPQYVSPDSSAQKLCFFTDAGYLSVPVFFAQ